MRPDGGIKPHRDGFAPVHHGAFDDARVGQHERLGAGGIDHGGLRGCIQFAPCRSLAVQQRFPASGLAPPRQFSGWNALLFEVMKAVG